VTSACHAAQKAASEIVETGQQILTLSKAEVKRGSAPLPK
jgi:hypothetical protein